MVKAAAALLAMTLVAHADPANDLRIANAAAIAGDWQKVAATVGPLTSLTRTEQAEAERLAGLAAFFLEDKPGAEQHFHAYLRLDLDGNLDPQLYPPEVIAFFIEVRTKYGAELRALRPHQKRYLVIAPIPVASQWQNGDHVKAIVVGSAIAAFAATNISSYFVLRHWCTDTGSNSATCDNGGSDHVHSARTMSTVNLVSGIALIATIAFGVYDGVSGYRQRTHEIEPYASLADHSGVVGIAGTWGR